MAQLEQGLSDWRVYSAEESVGYDEPLEDVEQCQRLVDSVVSSGWRRELFTDVPITVTVGGYEIAGREAGVVVRFRRWVSANHSVADLDAPKNDAQSGTAP